MRRRLRANREPSDQQTISLLVRQIKELQQHDHDMQERIKLIEAKQTDAPEKPSSDPVVAPEPEEQATPIPPPPLDLTFGARNPMARLRRGQVQSLRSAPARNRHLWIDRGLGGNFYAGDFGLFLTARLSDKASVLSEIVFEEDNAQTFTADLRRMLLKYDVNDHLKISVGRYQTSIGYYNWAFRSAAWLQTTADRPLVMEFASNGGILPTQAIGVSVTGSIPSGKLGLNYVAEYGSSDTIRPDINGDGLLNDENNGNLVNVGFFLHPDSIRGLQVGASIYHDQISDLNSLASASGIQVPPPGNFNIPNELWARWNQTIVNGHIVYASQKTEFLNEGFLIRHALSVIRAPTRSIRRPSTRNFREILGRSVLSSAIST